jgi:hypothetical protein
MPGLLASARPVALTSPDGRVIAATAPDLAPGLRWPASGEPGDAPGGAVTSSPLGEWKLADL